VVMSIASVALIGSPKCRCAAAAGEAPRND
jgi:hypothetical protein